MSNDKRINSSALLSTAIKPTVQFYRIWKNKEGLVNFGINASGKIKGVFALTQDFFTELENIEKKSLENLPKIKNLIHFQGTNDSSVPFEQGHFEYIKKNTSKPFKSVLIEDVGHSYDDKQDFVIKEILKWFKEHLH